MVVFQKILKNKSTKNYSFLFIANLLGSASQWIILTLIAKIYGTNEMGSYSLVIAFALPLYAFFTLQLRNIYVADQEGKYHYSTFLNLRALSALLFLFCMLFIGAVFYRPLFLIFLFVGLSKFIEMFSDIIHAYFHKKQLIQIYCKQLIYRSILAITLNLVFFSFFKSFQLALISLPLAYLIVLLVDFLLISKQTSISFSITWNENIKRMVYTGLFSGCSLLLVYMLPGIPRFFLEKVSGKFNLGIFSGYLSLVVFSRIFVQSITQNSLPKLSLDFDTNNFLGFINTIKKETAAILIIGLLQFLIIPVSDIVFPLLFNKDFKGNHFLLTIIFLGSLFSFLSFVFNNGLNAMKLFKVQLPVYLASSIFSIIAGYILIPKLGLMGAAYVFTSTSFIQCCLLAGFLIYSLKDKLWFSKTSIASS